MTYDELCWRPYNILILCLPCIIHYIHSCMTWIEYHDLARLLVIIWLWFNDYVSYYYLNNNTNMWCGTYIPPMTWKIGIVLSEHHTSNQNTCALQGPRCLNWQKSDKPLSTVLSIRRPWFGHLVDNFLSYLLSYRTKIHVRCIVTIPQRHVGSTPPCQHLHLCESLILN